MCYQHFDCCIFWQQISVYIGLIQLKYTYVIGSHHVSRCDPFWGAGERVTPFPKDLHALVPANCGYVTLYGKRDSVNAIQ